MSTLNNVIDLRNCVTIYFVSTKSLCKHFDYYVTCYKLEQQIMGNGRYKHFIVVHLTQSETRQD